MHWMAVKRIHYVLLEGHIRCDITHWWQTYQLYKGIPMSDWAGNVENCRSTSGCVFFVGKGAVAWNSKQQQTVAQFTMKAEYMTT